MARLGPRLRLVQGAKARARIRGLGVYLNTHVIDHAHLNY